ncbi:MAG: fatty acid desaturase, partial [Verrucomicrobiae bacterium]|nr:fatty acid desaturase [Verrucomicrobiae bacterium]
TIDEPPHPETEDAQETSIYKPYRALLSPDRVKELSVLNSVRPVLDTLWMWTCIVAAWALVAWYPTWWTVLLAIPVVGTRFYGLFIIGHDGMHRRIFSKTSANDLFCDVFILGPIGAITRINNRNHLEHHLYLSTDRDPDRHKHACFNKSTKPEYVFFLSGLMSLLPALGNVYAKPSRKAKEGAQKKKHTPRDLAILLGWQVVLIGGLTWAIGWWAYPVLWLFPVYVFAYLADLVRSFLEHAHPESDEKADKHRLITYLSNPIERRIFAPMNMNFHAAHHLWTSIPYYNLKKADEEMRRNPDSAGLEWRGSYFGFLFRYFFALPLPECRHQPAAKA